MYCTHCGAELAEEAEICPACGCATENYKSTADSKKKTPDILRFIAKIVMIVTCAVEGMAVIPLCWMLPMTLHYNKCLEENIPVSLAFKICTIIFVNVAAGVLMIIADELE